MHWDQNIQCQLRKLKNLDLLRIALGPYRGTRSRDGLELGRYKHQSFYPPHHITMGEGGAVNMLMKKVV